MPSRRIPAVLLAGAAALTAALAAPVGASATSLPAPPWTVLGAIPGAAPAPAPLIFTGDGRALAFPASDRSAAAPAGAATEVVSLSPESGAPTGPPRGLTVAAVQAVAYARDRYVLAGSTLDARGTISDRSHVQVGYGTGGGDIGPLKGIPGSTGERSFALAANDDGVVAIVLGDTKERRLLIRRPNGRGFVQAFGTKVGSQGRGATVAVGAKGDVLMAWENAHRIYARHVGPSGSVGAVHRVGDGVQSHLQAAVEAGGRLMIAWASQRVNEGESDQAASVFLVTAAPGKGFNKPRLLENSGPVGTGLYVADPAVRLATGGASLVAWTGFDVIGTQRFVVRVAQVDDGHVGSAQVVSPAGVNAVLGDLDVQDDGGAGVVWRTGVAGADPDGASQQVQAAVRATATDAFSAPETVVGAPSGSTFPYPPRLALQPAGDRALMEYGEFAGSSSLFRVAARRAP